MKIFKKSRGLTLILLAALLLEIISGIQYYYTHDMLADELEKRAELELTTKVILTKSNMNLAVNSVNGHLWDVMRNIHHPDSMLDVAECVLRSHKNLLGCGIAFEPNFYPMKGRLRLPATTTTTPKTQATRRSCIRENGYGRSRTITRRRKRR